MVIRAHCERPRWTTAHSKSKSEGAEQEKGPHLYERGALCGDHSEGSRLALMNESEGLRHEAEWRFICLRTTGTFAGGVT